MKICTVTCHHHHCHSFISAESGTLILCNLCRSGSITLHSAQCAAMCVGLRVDNTNNSLSLAYKSPHSSLVLQLSHQPSFKHSLPYPIFKTMSAGLPQFYLPDLVAQWPWPRVLNQHYAEAKPESDEWLRSFEALDAKSQRSFDRCDFGEWVTCSQVNLSTE